MLANIAYLNIWCFPQQESVNCAILVSVAVTES